MLLFHLKLKDIFFSLILHSHELFWNKFNHILPILFNTMCILENKYIALGQEFIDYLHQKYFSREMAEGKLPKFTEYF